MKTRRSLIVLLLISIITLTACSNQEDLVRERLTGFLEDMKKFDLEAMSEYILESDGDFSMENLEKDDFTSAFMDYFKENSKKISYEIKSISIDKDKAEAELEIKYIDGENLFKYSLADLIEESFGMSLVDGGLDESEMDKLGAKILEDNKNKIGEEYTSLTTRVELSKVEGEWYLDSLDDKLLGVLTSNYINILNQLEDGLGEAEGGRKKDKDKDLTRKNIGEELELSSLRLKVNTVEEVDELKLLSKKNFEAAEGKKFVLVGIDITNITNRDFKGLDNLMLVDNKSTEYKGYRADGLKDNIIDKKLGPNKKERGILYFEIDADASGYGLFIEDEGRLYEIALR